MRSNAGAATTSAAASRRTPASIPTTCAGCSTAGAPLRAHSRVQAKSTRRIEGHITHYSYRDYDDLFARANKYSTWQAEEMLKEGRSASLAKATLHATASFVKHYILKRGFLAGRDGLTISIAKALTSYLKYAKLIELRKEAGK